MEFTSFVLRSVLCVVFLAGAVGKASRMPSFLETVRALGIPAGAGPVLGWTLVAMELAAAGLLASGWAAPATVVVALLIAIFAAASVRGWLNADPIRCSCFGRSESVLGPWTLSRSVLLALLLAGYRLTLAAAGGEAPRTPETLLAALALVVIVLMLGRWFTGAPLVLALVRSRRAEPAPGGAAE